MSSHKSKVLLQTINVNKVYKLGDTQIYALKDISVSIAEGEYVAITGKSGSGKSTLMHIVGLLDTPSSGEVVVNGKNTLNYNEKELAKLRNKEVGFIFQTYDLMQRTNALENVMLPLTYSDVPESEWRDRGVEMLKRVGLADRMYNKSNELSGGQRQRVAIARALINNPSIVLADEPTGNLDSKTGADIVQMFKELNNEGKTIVLVTHDEELASVAERQIILKDGEILSQ
jgi:putative ABC transport system ATP-binding protein